MKGQFHLDHFTGGLADMTRMQQANPARVLHVLQKAGRYSLAEAAENQIIARTMLRIFADGLAMRTGGDCPWVTVELTDAGRLLVERNPL